MQRLVIPADIFMFVETNKIGFIKITENLEVK
jgi:hypothetical protein